MVPKRVVAYVRVSTSQQADKGNSLEAQQALLTKYAELHNLEIVQFAIDAASASSLERAGLQEALDRLDRFEAEGLLVVKLDRLTRSVRDLCDLVDTYFRDGQYNLISVSEHIDTFTAAGRMVLNILTVIGQWEREAIGERTAAVMQHMKAEGLFTGGFPPYGWRVDEAGALVAVPEELALIDRAKALRERGAALRTIALELGVNKRTGKPFAASQIARMI